MKPSIVVYLDRTNGDANLRTLRTTRSYMLSTIPPI